MEWELASSVGVVVLSAATVLVMCWRLSSRRADLERARIERAEAVNDAIEWRRRYTEQQEGYVGRARAMQALADAAGPEGVERAKGLLRERWSPEGAEASIAWLATLEVAGAVSDSAAVKEMIAGEVRLAAVDADGGDARMMSLQTKLEARGFSVAGHYRGTIADWPGSRCDFTIFHRCEVTLTQDVYTRERPCIIALSTLFSITGEYRHNFDTPCTTEPGPPRPGASSENWPTTGAGSECRPTS